MFEQKLKELQAQVEGLNLERTGPLAEQLATVQAQQELLGRQLSEIQRGIETEARDREDLAARQRSVEHHLGQVLDIFGTMQNKLASVGSLPEQALSPEQRTQLAEANDEFNVV